MTLVQIIMKKRRGRPRGKNYKKKSPHRIIGFEELTKFISKRWKFKKKEYCKLYGSIVKENRRRYKQDMLLFNKKKKYVLKMKQVESTIIQKQSSSSKMRQRNEVMMACMKENAIQIQIIILRLSLSTFMMNVEFCADAVHWTSKMRRGVSKSSSL